MGDKCKLMRAPRHPEWETSVNSCDKCKTQAATDTQSERQVWETNVNPCGPRNREWETSVGDKCGTTSVGDKCKLMRPKAPRVRDKCGRQV